ncbi:MAG: hypothetical protein NTV00_00510 [Methylococcales bacterium]|nr:hypothetical protein [Methylococcales bacterium]
MSALNTANAKTGLDAFYTQPEHFELVQQAQAKTQTIAQQAASGSKLNNSDLVTVQQNAVINEYQLALDNAELEFKQVDKLKLPIAPKDPEGNYYISLSAPDIGVSLPTKFGNFYIDVKATRYRMLMADLRLKADNINKPVRLAKLTNPVAPLTSWQINAIGSSLYRVTHAGFDEHVLPNQSTALGDHGSVGGWVGFQAETVGNAIAWQGTICGQTPNNVQYYIYANTAGDGQPADGFGVRAWMLTDCTAGDIVTTVQGSNGSLSDTLHFN